MEESITPGIWKHYKGGLYRVLGTVRHHETGKDMVLYVSLKYGTVNVRPVRGWLGDEDGWLDRAQLSELANRARFEFIGPAISGDVPE